MPLLGGAGLQGLSDCCRLSSGSTRFLSGNGFEEFLWQGSGWRIKKRL